MPCTNTSWRGSARAISGSARDERPGAGEGAWSAGKPGSANRGSPPRLWKASMPSRTRGYAIFVLRSTRPARFIRLLATAGLAHDDTPQAWLDQLDAVLAQNSS
jgi:hypothetical protein